MAQQTVVGIFDNVSEANKAVDDLVSKGFSRASIDVSAQTGTYTDDTYNTGTTGTMNTSDAVIPDRHVNTSGTYTEEVADDTKDAGDSIGNFFSNLFGGGDDDDDRHRKYADVGRRGSIVTVHAQSEEEAEQAADILDDNGAVNVDEKATQYGYGAMGKTTDAKYTGTTMPDGNQTIKVIEENLEVGKREVETGGVRVRSRIVERPVEESIRLREERVTVQRNPVNRPATDADLTAFKEGEVEMREHAEVPVVSKTANVVEEISIGKEVNEREEKVSDTVRKTEVDVENLKSTVDTPMRTDYDDTTRKM